MWLFHFKTKIKYSTFLCITKKLQDFNYETVLGSARFISRLKDSHKNVKFENKSLVKYAQTILTSSILKLYKSKLYFTFPMMLPASCKDRKIKLIKYSLKINR